MKRTSGIFVLIGLALGAAGAGWVAAQALASPDDPLFDASAPEPSPITAPVELRVLESVVVVRGVVQFAESEEISLHATVGGVVPVVTGAVPSVGDTAKQGTVLLEVSERPIILLQGELPMFRTLGLGMSGGDVRQFEQALARLSFEPGPIDGVFDLATEAATERLYASVGYEPLGLSEDEETTLAEARVAEDQAADSLRGARESLDMALQPPEESARLAFDLQVDSAQRVLDDCRKFATDVEQMLHSELTTANEEAAIASIALGVATDRWRTATAGVHPGTGLPTTSADVEAFTVEMATAEMAWEEATELVDELRQKVADLSQISDVCSDESVYLEIAVASRDEAFRVRDTTSEREVVADASEALDLARVHLAALQSELGPRARVDEILFLDSLPKRVDEVMVERGDVVSDAVVRLSGVELVVNSAISEADRQLLFVGDDVVIQDASLGVELQGEILFIADSKGTNDVADSRYFMSVSPTGGDPAELRGLNVRISIPISTTGEPVLVVPMAALFSDADGTVHVQILRESGVVELADVSVGLSASGYVELLRSSSLLLANDLVVVGLSASDVESGS